MSPPHPPPRLFEWLLSRALPAGIVREDVVGSLAQEHAARVERDGAWRAGWWYRRQVLGIVARGVGSSVVHGDREGTMGEMARELGKALRRLGKAPAFSLAVVATLALGIGGTTAVFAIVHGVLVQPLPYPDAERLVWIRNGAPDREWSFSMADYLALEEQQTAFDRVAAYDPNGITLTTSEGSERLEAHMVSSGFLPVLGIEPILGRGIAASDNQPGAERVVLLTHAIWQSRFGSDPGIAGRSVTLDQQATTVIGVLPPPLGPIERTFDFLMPLTLEPPPRKGPFFMYVIGRLGDESARPAAAAELAAISERIFPIWQDSFRDAEVRWIMRDLKEAVLGDVGSSLWMAMAAVAGLLLIALTNAANLLVARAVEQEREVAVRAALGAGWSRILGYRLSESALLSVLGAGAGLGLAAGGLALASELGADFIPRVSEAALGGPVSVFLVAVTTGCVALLAVVPAMQNRAPLAALRSGGRTSSGAAGARRLRQGLVVAQLAVTVPLLVGGALLASSLLSLRSVDPGFEPDGLLTVRATLPGVGYATSADRRDFWTRVVAEVAALPGVESVGVGNGLPPDNPGFGNNFVLEDVPIPPGAAQFSVPWVIAGGGYFEALGVPLLAGRMFDADTDSSRVVLVDDSWARRFFDGPDDAVNRRFVHGGCTDLTTCPLWTVIGVVGDVDYNGLAATDEGAMYMDAERYPSSGFFLTVRAATAGPASLAPAIRRIVHAADPRVPVTDIATGHELLRESLQADRYLAGLIGVFGLVALLLSLVGVYGVLAYFVEHHRRDIGIRLALGGEPGRVAALVMKTAMRLVAAGLAVGLLAALALSRLMEQLLFGVEPWDPAAFGAVLAGLGAAALLACWAPARRAARLDPALTLKEE